MKKLFSALLLCLFTVMMIASSVFAATKVTVKMDGQALRYNEAPYIVDDHALVPLRTTFEALGAQVTWLPSTSQIRIQVKQNTALLQVGSKDYLLNGQKKTLDVPVQLSPTWTSYAPVRLISQLLPIDIRWDAKANTVNLCAGTCNPKTYPKAPAMSIDTSKTYTATVKTNKGDFTIQLLAKQAPLTVNNFVFLARDHYFDNVPFHRIVKPFMIQTGDPTGTGTGGPGYTFKDELPPAVPYAPGVVAMANYGPNTNGSQFFIGTGDQVKILNQHPNYTVFGVVTQGMDVVETIASTPVIASEYGELSKPTEDVHIVTVDITEQ